MKSCYGFRREREKMGRRGVVFCHVYDAPLLPLSLDRFLPNFPRTRVQVASRDTWFHIPVKFPRDRICRKTLFLGYPICDQPTGHGKRSAEPTLFPSPWWASYRCALPRWLLLRDVPFSSYLRPNVFVCHGISNGETWMPMFFSNILARGRVIGSPICTGTLFQCTFSSYFLTPYEQCRNIDGILSDSCPS